MSIQKTLGDNDITFDICTKIILCDEFNIEFNLIYKVGVLIDLLFISDQSIREDILNNIKITLNQIYSIDGIINRLLQSAFIFSSLTTNGLESEDKIEKIDNIKNKAYRIAISLYQYSKLYSHAQDYDVSLNNIFNNNDVIYALFTKLGILSKIRGEGIEGVNIYDINLRDKISFATKEVNNTFSISKYLDIEISDENYYLSDFQKEALYDVLLAGKSAILSAPTSAGKTFIVKKFIITKLLNAQLRGECINIGFILPTKALINEIRLDFIELIKVYGIEKDINIHIHISGKEFIDKQFFKKSNLFILTQERLNYLYTDLKYNYDYFLHFRFMAVDEAHKIAYGYRGTLLSYIINEIIADNKLTQICFLAPLLKKLSKIKDNFKLDTLEFKFSNFGLVAKNLIYLKKIKGKPLWEFYLNINGVELFLFSYKFKNLSQPEYLAHFANKFSGGDTSSLIFRRYPNETIQQASKIKELINIEVDYDFSYLKDYIKDTLSDDFELIGFLEKGIAFHNGLLPVSIRKEVENIYKNTKILKYLCVNSTVLEGVNLPAKNIFIGESAKDIPRFHLSKLNLKNLIGRAGRLNNHMSGNIFFIDPITYEEKISGEENSTEDFIGSIELLVKDDGKIIRFLSYLSGNDYKKPTTFAEDKERRDFEYMTGYLLSMYIKYGEIEFISEIKKLIYTNDKDNIIDSLKVKISILHKDRLSSIQSSSILEKVLIKNIFVDPRKQIDLYENLYDKIDNEFIDMLNEYSRIMILIRGNSDKERKKKLLNLLITDAEKYFIYSYKSKIGLTYFPNSGIIKGLVNQWLSEVSLKDIIKNYNIGVSETLKLINEEVLFKYSNAISIYIDIVNAVFQTRKHDLNLKYDGILPDEIDFDFKSFLEIGAYLPTTIYLISKGVDRESAIFLKDNVYRQIGLKKHKKPYRFFQINRDKLFIHLENNGKLVILSELKKYVF